MCASYVSLSYTAIVLRPAEVSNIELERTQPILRKQNVCESASGTCASKSTKGTSGDVDEDNEGFDGREEGRSEGQNHGGDESRDNG